MKAAIIYEHGEEDVFRYDDVPDPAPGAGEVLVRVGAAAVNRGDIGRRQGRYAGGPTPLPLIIGWDIAGTVEALGPGASGPAVGTRVVARIPQGGYAELAIVPAEGGEIAPIPEGVSFEQAAALPVAFLTAWFALKDEGALKAGETVLVQAGASGVGAGGIQLAKRWGARVLTTASADEKLALCKRLGADVTINYTTADFLDVVKQETDGRGVDVVLEPVGGEVLSRSVEALAIGGRLVSVGNSARQPAPGDFAVLMGKRAHLHGFVLTGHAGQADALSQMMNWIAEGTFDPVIDRTFPLAETAAAHRHLAGRANLGKVLLIP